MMLACHAADGPAGVASPLHGEGHNDGAEFKNDAEMMLSGVNKGQGTAAGTTTTISAGAVASMGCADLPRVLAPEDYEGWISSLAEVSSLRQLGIMLAWGCRAGHSPVMGSGAGPAQPPVSRKGSGGLFPLPVCWPDDFSGLWREKYATHCTDFAAECWLGCACVALNAYYGCGHKDPVRKPGKVHERALEALKDKIGRFLQGDVSNGVSFLGVVADLIEKRVSYTGEEVSQPFPLSAEQIEKSLPPIGHGGCIDATDFLVGRAKFLLENPQECLLPLRDREAGSMQAKVHIKKGEELLVFKLLESRGVTSWIEAEEVFSDDMGECLNGLFGVVKPGKFCHSGAPVLRVIMNLVPANRLFQVICGDVHLLPHGTSWMPLVVSEGEELRISQSDMSAAFYLFAVPPCWRQYMSFAYKVRGDVIGKEKDKFYRPCCIVLPMGWSSSVGLMQMISRQLLLTQGSLLP